jgi:hypothetical protein
MTALQCRQAADLLLFWRADIAAIAATRDEEASSRGRCVGLGAATGLSAARRSWTFF